jgi:hypothetical protein
VVDEDFDGRDGPPCLHQDNIRARGSQAVLDFDLIPASGPASDRVSRAATAVAIGPGASCTDVKALSSLKNGRKVKFRVCVQGAFAR